MWGLRESIKVKFVWIVVYKVSKFILRSNSDIVGPKNATFFDEVIGTISFNGEYSILVKESGDVV